MFRQFRPKFRFFLRLSNPLSLNPSLNLPLKPSLSLKPSLTYPPCFFPDYFRGTSKKKPKKLGKKIERVKRKKRMASGAVLLVCWGRALFLWLLRQSFCHFAAVGRVRHNLWLDLRCVRCILFSLRGRPSRFPHSPMTSSSLSYLLTAYSFSLSLGVG